MLTGPERALRALSWALFATSLGFVGVYLYAGLIDDADYPFTVNSVAKDLLLAALALLVARDVRRFASIGVPLIVMAHLALAAVLALTWGHDGTEHTLAAPRLPWLAADLVIAAIFIVVSFLAVRARYGLRYLWPAGFRALISLAEVLVDPARVPPEKVGARADAYLASFKATEKIKVWGSLQLLGYWPLATLRPPFHLMSPDTRRAWVERRFLRTRGDLRRAVVRTAQQFAFMGYYGDEDAAREVGYIPFSQRSPGVAASQRVTAGRLTCLTTHADQLEAEIVVVGSGAAGAMLAHELAERGHEVLVLERGSHVDPSTFTENEADQLARLYRDGALTLSKDFRFQVAQGMCVGGSTVINNAVCFDLPDAVRDRWNDEHEAGLDAERLDDAFRYVRDFLRIAPLGPGTVRNPGAEHLVKLLERHEDPPLTLSVVDCNIHDCLGSGYCNIGCAWGRKLSALDWTLPEAQRKHPDAVRVLPDCQVLKVGQGRKVEARIDGRRVTVQAREAVVLSAGALASSVILQRSGLGGDRVGRGLSFNLASPVTLDFDARPALRARRPDHALLRARRRDPRELVQPRRHAVAVHARLVRRAPREHAPLPQHDLPRRRDRDGVQRAREARPHARRREPRLHADGRGLRPHQARRDPGLRDRAQARGAACDADDAARPGAQVPARPAADRAGDPRHGRAARELRPPAGRQPDLPQSRTRASSTSASRSTASRACTSATPRCSRPRSPSTRSSR